jgi:hypothetical protein
MAAMVGFHIPNDSGNGKTMPARFNGGNLTCPVRSSVVSLRSAPAQKNLSPAPVKMAILACLSSWNFYQPSERALESARFKEFPFSGRFIVITTTLPSNIFSYDKT